MAFPWAMAAEAGGALASKGIDFGLGVAGSKIAAEQQYKLTRKLRRREYQDMMHSMRHAGLNPILASGATPGHSAAYSSPIDLGGDLDLVGSYSKATSARAAERQAGVSESTAPSVIGLNTASAAQRQADTDVARATVPRLVQDLRNAEATNAEILQRAKTGVAQQNFYEAQAHQLGWSAKKTEAEIHALETFGPPGTSFPGMFRAWLGQGLPGSDLKGRNSDASASSLFDYFARGQYSGRAPSPSSAAEGERWLKYLKDIPTPPAR